MSFLCIDTSSRILRVCLYRPQEDFFSITEIDSFSHSDRLFFLIQECLEKNGQTLSALEAIVCAKGPGSYTGLRIGLATAKGIGFALKIPMVLVHCLDWVATACQSKTPLLVCNTAYGNRIYAKLYPSSPRIEDIGTSTLNNQKISPIEQLLSFQDTLIGIPDLISARGQLPLQFICAGTAFEKNPMLYNELSQNNQATIINPSALSTKHFATVGYNLYQKGYFPDPRDAIPLYIGVSAAEENLTKKE